MTREQLKTAQSKQKSNADNMRRKVEFQEEDHVFLRASPTKRVRFVGLFEVLGRVGKVAYKLALPPELSSVHNVYQVSLLRKHVPNLNHVIDYTPLHVRENLK